MGLISNYRAVAGPVLLRWSEAPNAPLREEFVQLLEAHLSETVLRSALEICEKTKVYLKTNLYAGDGIVRSCRREGRYFVLSISMAPGKDPGMLVVEQFLTEEDERRILEQLEDLEHTA